jgi:hypothetical protein
VIVGHHLYGLDQTSGTCEAFTGVTKKRDDDRDAELFLILKEHIKNKQYNR